MNLCDIPKVLIFCDISQTHKCCDLDHLKPHMYLVNRCKAYLTNVDGLLFFDLGLKVVIRDMQNVQLAVCWFHFFICDCCCVVDFFL